MPGESEKLVGILKKILVMSEEEVKVESEAKGLIGQA
jgi:hypothetical protein